MSFDCYCDYETPKVYASSVHASRVARKCDECGRGINPGDKYERAASLYDDSWSVFQTCARCVSFRDYVTAHVPCLCWAHGNMIEDVIAAIDEYAHEAPGLRFGAARRFLRGTILRAAGDQP